MIRYFPGRCPLEEVSKSCFSAQTPRLTHYNHQYARPTFALIQCKLDFLPYSAIPVRRHFSCIMSLSMAVSINSQIGSRRSGCNSFFRLLLSLQTNLGSFCSIIWSCRFLKPRMLEGLLRGDTFSRVVNEDLP